MIITEREGICPALRKYYSRLARFMIALVEIPENAIILEAGCGDGALTCHLLSLLPDHVVVGYDLFSGVYEESLSALTGAVSQMRVIRGDVRTMSLHTESVDLVISNELLCDLSRNDTQVTLNEFYRILRKGGTFIHGCLSPYPETRAQELVLLADSYSADPLFDHEWFSPPADELAGMVHSAGFRQISVTYFSDSLKFTGDAAFCHLEEWVLKPEFFEKYSSEVRARGIEYPMEQVIHCCK
ncbi:MAG: methyltransferase domain-containing protein [Theionarchaea archaeon]|nr:methyltransferase domain-containing protein [Theionarchaea archaeon]MBU7000613.1 methyltransferase domain-containing protein [Theionarchaea archaeon]MBU7022004.1 methyltransferase domain-containing protein [Theionarchaea archaeon]MBU7035957.1 methyltransferase domain-containing protein [Theionarchaea archaeon]MBU7041776.1 methyltransferase domain-containing protein [Theionarchaea archaeon]